VIVPRLIGFAALLLAGCSERDQAAPPSPLEEPASPPAATAQTPVAATERPAGNVAVTKAGELVGEYRVAGVNGREIDLPYGLAASLNEVGIMIEADCLVLSWVYFFEGSRLVTEQLFPRASCGRRLLPEEEAIVTALNGANKVSRTATNGLEFSGGGHSVLLFSQ
jgi:hypothetical protein